MGGNSTVAPTPEHNKDDLVYLSNNKKTIEDSSHQGSFGSSEDSLQKHYEKHGNEVSTAKAFATNLRGARTANISGTTDGVTRYYKNGKYIDMSRDGRIISFDQ